MENTGKSIGRNSGCELSPEVVLLQATTLIEAYLVAKGMRPELEAAAAEVHSPPEAVSAWRKKNHGTEVKKNSSRIATNESAGWEDRLIIDFLVKAQDRVGGCVRASSASQQDPQLVPTPPSARQLGKIDTLLGETAP